MHCQLNSAPSSCQKLTKCHDKCMTPYEQRKDIKHTLLFTVDDRRDRLRRHADRQRWMRKITKGRPPPSHALAPPDTTCPSIDKAALCERGETATRAPRSSKVERVNVSSSHDQVLGRSPLARLCWLPHGEDCVAKHNNTLG
jgi:hypothetical protein